MDFCVKFIDLGGGRLLSPTLFGRELEQVFEAGAFSGGSGGIDLPRVANEHRGVVCYLPDGSLMLLVDSRGSLN